ncbi:hypothetical protein WMY93_031659 [Mugilogobius chulae]|uniref:Vesicle transport protein n=1 Tax=Mugilogobius chulae TaxID=88201 RepID=A0AAW0MFJ0_9GOBI
MADLNRQLQEYLSQSKSGRGVSSSGSSTAVDLGDSGEEEPGPGAAGSWFGRWSSPFPRKEAQSSGSSGSWPWSVDPDPCLPGLSRGQRLVGFGVCAAFSALCFGLSALYAPLLLLYARKFALLWSLGSLFAIAAVAMLRGPGKLLYGLPTSPASAAYLCALASTALTALGAAAQVAIIAGAVVTLLPGGAAGMRFMSGLAASAIKRTERRESGQRAPERADTRPGESGERADTGPGRERPESGH